MKNIELNNISEIQKNDLKKGVFLCISHADKIPPHIGISSDGEYFSIRVNGKDEVETDKIFRSIQLKKIPSLFVKLGENSFSIKRFTTVRNEYVSINEEVKTCLVPILDLFEIKERKYLLHDFLHFLAEKKLILAYFALNLPTDFQGIPSYQLEDVSKHLETLKNAKRSKYIFESNRAK